MSSLKKFAPVAITAALTLSLAACSGAADSATSSASTQPAAATTAVDEVKRGELPEPLVEEFTAEGTSITNEDSAALPLTAVFHAVRVAEHDSFYRVVVEFKRDASSEKRAEGQELMVDTQWVQEVKSQGKGNTLENSGKEVLDLVVKNTTVPQDAAQEGFYYAGDKNVKVGPLDITVDGTYEGNTHIAIGMDKKLEYGVAFLDGPTRVVVDIKK